MADVHRATDRLLHREVAVKVLRPTSTSETERARFAGEARTLAVLNHPGLVTLLDAGFDDDQPFLVMELIEGPTLARRIQEDGPMPPAEVAVIGAQLADALACAHAAGIVHRDVKPSNILVRADGSAVLTDFGIARLLDSADQHTNPGDTIGSPAYLSPEQVTGAAPTPAVDVYSLGLVLLEALTGLRSYSGPPIEAALARLTTPPVIPGSLEVFWRDLLTRMTRREPTERPSAREVLATLDGTASERTAVLVPRLDEARLPRRQRWGALVGAAAVLAVILGGAGLVLTGPDKVAAGTPALPTGAASLTPTPTPTRSRSPKPAPRRTYSTPVMLTGHGRKHGPDAGKQGKQKKHGH
ncbi:MAG: pknB 3 [Marmoricola sp.]|nr:pknB 3 [Marmoricola sp.]